MLTTSAIIQIAVLYLVIYTILKSAKGSRFGQVLMGVGLLAALLFAFSFVLHFEVLSRIIKLLLFYLAISTVVIFQPEIRRGLSAIGTFGFLEKPKYRPDGGATPELVIDTLIDLSDLKMGALVAFERGISLRSYESTGVMTDAIFSKPLMRSIFTPPLPLHDGGVVIRDGRVSSAHSIFPVSNNPDLITSGMRHRAAVGLTEETDALVVVVSEESGAISVSHNGHLYRFTGEQRRPALTRWISKAMPEDRREHGILHALRESLERRARKLTKGD